MNLFCFGLGYSALTLASRHRDQFARISGTVRTEAKRDSLRAAGLDAHVLHEDKPPSDALSIALMTSESLLVSAAPDDYGDPMLRHVHDTLAQSRTLRTVIYLSTVGVYGDHRGGWVDETTPALPTSRRAQRRVMAEQAWQRFGERHGVAVQIHRLAGIYGPGRSVLDDLREGTARRIIKEGQVFNRIHVDDIAGAVAAGFRNPTTSGLFNVCDDEPCPPQDVVVYGADLLGLPPPPEMPFAEAKLSEMGRSFYSESKRCRNTALKAILGYSLQHRTYREGLRSLLEKA